MLTKELTHKKTVKIFHILIGAQSDLLQFKYPRLTTLVAGFIEVVRIIGGTEGLEHLISESKRVLKIEKRVEDTAA